MSDAMWQLSLREMKELLRCERDLTCGELGLEQHMAEPCCFPER